jgi:uncharacterized protein YndB with AHSA1/START domain
LNGRADLVRRPVPQYNFSSSASGTAPYLATRKLLPTLLEPFFASFRETLVDVHGKDMLAAPEAASGSASGSSTPAASAPTTTSSAATPVAKDASSSAAVPKINTSEVAVSAELRVSAADLWELLTSEQKIPTWSRSSAQFSPTPGAPFALFGGSVTGSILSASKPSAFSSTWALAGAPSWPAGHEGTLDVALEQGSEATKATFTLKGVPKGREKEMESNLHAFYIRGCVVRSGGLVDISGIQADPCNASVVPRFVAMGLVQSVLPATTKTASSPLSRSSARLSSASQPASAQRSRPKAPKGPAASSASALAGPAIVGALVVGLGALVWSTLR